MKRGRYWTFALVDPTGGSLLRMSTQNKPDGELWVAFFKQAGCTIEVRLVSCMLALPPLARARSGNARRRCVCVDTDVSNAPPWDGSPVPVSSVTHWSDAARIVSCLRTKLNVPCGWLGCPQPRQR
jgi:hypothetical protein